MATTENYHPRRDVSLSENDLEKKVGDITARFRLANKVLGLKPDESMRYGPLKIRRVEREFLIAGVDGEVMEPIPSFNFDAPEMASLLDHKIECSLSQL